jgi:hypothetical protein
VATDLDVKQAILNRLAEMQRLVESETVTGIIIVGMSQNEIHFTAMGEMDVETVGQSLDEIWESVSGADTPSAPDMGYRMGMH